MTRGGQRKRPRGGRSGLVSVSGWVVSVGRGGSVDLFRPNKVSFGSVVRLEGSPPVFLRVDSRYGNSW